MSFSQKTFNPLLITALSFSLALTIFGINATKSLKVCSLFFVTFMAIVRWLTTYTDEKKAFGIGCMAIFINALILGELSLLSVCSFAGLGASIVVNIGLSRFLGYKKTFIYSFVLPTFLAILTDALVMYVWEFNRFGLTKSFIILSRGLCYKGMVLIAFSSVYLLISHSLYLFFLITESEMKDEASLPTPGK